MKHKVIVKSKGITFTVKSHSDCMGYTVSTEGKAPPILKKINKRRLATIRCYYPYHIRNDRYGPRQQLRLIRHWYRRKGWA